MKLTSKEHELPRHGLLRLRNVIKPHGPLPISRSAWWHGCKTGRYPAPVKLGPRITAWREADIQRLIDAGINPDR
jgi:prophage regulatory protein